MIEKIMYKLVGVFIPISICIVNFNFANARITRCIATSGVFSGSHYSYYETKLYCDASLDPNYNGDYNQCYYDIFNNGYESHVFVLRINECRGTRLDENLRNRFTNLRTLDISSYGVESLSSVDLNFGYLQNLSAPFNQLTFIPASLFVHAPDVASIDFSHNKISSVDENAFSGLLKLNSLNLSHNLIKSFHENTFLTGSEGMLSLDLTHNPIFNNCNIFLLNTHSAEISISWENVTEFDTTCRKVSFDNTFRIAKDGRLRRDFRISTLGNSKKFKINQESFKNIEYFNISGNELLNTDEVIDLLGTAVETLDVSFNRIEELSAQTFARFPNLKYLDLSSTEISSIEPDVSEFVQNNRKLESLLLLNNPIKQFHCPFFSFLMQSAAVQVSWDDVEELDVSCLKNSLEIELRDDATNFRSLNTSIEMHFAKKDLQNLRSLNISGIGLQNTGNMIELLGSSIETLDLSANFVGKLNATSFGRFDNLQYLNLSRTNLTNFGFKTFYHQRKLKVLDISNNHLKTVNFTFFLRNFQQLTTLNLEGNDLKEVNTVTRENFPNLSTLGISKNQFSCDYLLSFVRQWHDIHLINNPSAQIHIDGVDCAYEEHDATKNIEINAVVPTVKVPEISTVKVSAVEVVTKATTKMTSKVPNSTEIVPAAEVLVPQKPFNKSDEIDRYHKDRDVTSDVQTQAINQVTKPPISESNLNQSKKISAAKISKKDSELNGYQRHANDEPNAVLAELRMLKYLLFVVIVICCGFMVLKSNLVGNIKRKWTHNVAESSVSYQQSEANSRHASVIELIKHENGQK